MTTRTVFDARGQRVHLGRELGRGGEGAVFEVPKTNGVTNGQPLVAKLYKSLPTPDKARKLMTMSRGATPALLTVAAWPVGTLHNASGGIVGLTMQRITQGQEIHYLYGPSHRRTAFPAADWKFLARASRNLAAAVATVHQAGAVIGDINQGNALIDAQARIKLIDCDSFQIRSDRGAWHLCEVGIGHFTPPELQGLPFDLAPRTVNHDAFGLAVLIFHLLFMGRHPYAGQFHGQGDMPIERAIRENRFAFSGNSRARLMSRPPNSLALTDTSPGFAALFERAFSAEAALGQVARPTAAEWVAALDTFERSLAPCATTTAHQVPAGAARCPWCAIETQGGPDFFSTVRYARAGMSGAAVQMPAGFDYSRLVKQVRQTVWSQQQPTPPAAAPGTAPVALDRTMLRRARQGRRAWVTGLCVLAGGALGYAPAAATAVGGSLVVLAAGLERRSGIRKLRRERQAAVGTAGAESALAKQECLSFEHSVATKTSQVKQAFEQAATKYDRTGTEEQRELARISTTQKDDQLRVFLERFFIDQADIPGLGGGLKATLASYGIETAADVALLNRRKVPGIGDARSRELRAWRDRLQQGFRFNPAVGAAPVAATAIREKAARQRATAAREMIAIADELERQVQRGLARRPELGSAYQAAESRFDALRSEVAALDSELRVMDTLTGRRGVAPRVAMIVGALMLAAQLGEASTAAEPFTAAARGGDVASVSHSGAATYMSPSRPNADSSVASAPAHAGIGTTTTHQGSAEPAPSNAGKVAVSAIAGPVQPVDPTAVIVMRCEKRDSVCVFPAARLNDPMLYEAGLPLEAAPVPVREGWFRVELRGGRHGFVRSVDMQRLAVPPPTIVPDYVP